MHTNMFFSPSKEGTPFGVQTIVSKQNGSKLGFEGATVGGASVKGKILWTDSCFVSNLASSRGLTNGISFKGKEVESMSHEDRLLYVKFEEEYRGSFEGRRSSSEVKEDEGGVFEVMKAASER